MDPLFVAWAAGFLDGEGCIHAGVRAPSDHHQGHVRFEVVVVQTTPEPLIALQRAFGGTLASGPARNARHRHQWRWRLAGRDARPFLEAVLPHLRVKRAVAELGIELAGLLHLHGLRVAGDELVQRQTIAEGIRALNRQSRSVA